MIFTLGSLPNAHCNRARNFIFEAKSAPQPLPHVVFNHR